jgi:ACR3 family arsenite efflux pump ArsB
MASLIGLIVDKSAYSPDDTLRPLAILFIKVISRETGTVAVSYETVATSVAVFLGISLGATILTRLLLRKLAGAEWYEKVFLKWLAPWSLIGLLCTILVLFAAQGRQVVHQIVSVVRTAAPLIVYFVVIFFFTHFMCNKLGYGYKLERLRALQLRVTTLSLLLLLPWLHTVPTAIRHSLQQ